MRQITSHLTEKNQVAPKHTQCKSKMLVPPRLRSYMFLPKLTSWSSLPASAMLVSSVLLERARPQVSWGLSTCCCSTWNAPSPDRHRASFLPAFRSLLKSLVLSKALPGLLIYPISDFCLAFTSLIPCFPFSFLLNTDHCENTLYLFTVFWLLSGTLKWKLHEGKIILFVAFLHDHILSTCA